MATDPFAVVTGGGVQAMLYSFGSSIALLIFGIMLCGGLIYILFIRKKTRKWGAVIWERKEDNLLVPVATDIVEEKYFNGGKQVTYILRKLKVEVFPPNAKTTYRKDGKDWCDYIRIQQEYIPVQRQLKLGMEKLNREEYNRKLLELSLSDKATIDHRYIYAPLVAGPHAAFNIDIMEHDVNMMRINAIDNRDKVYADQKSFMEKYGPTVGLALLTVGIIVIAYLSFDFIVKVQSGMLGPLQTIGDNLKTIILNCGGTEVGKPPV
jgi:hypothetical protein